jgi:hypothetical protein
MMFLKAAEFQINNYEVLGLDKMHIIDYTHYSMPNFSYSKVMPAPITFYNQNNFYFNADYSIKTHYLNGISIISILFYEAFSSFTNCGIVDYFTM